MAREIDTAGLGARIEALPGFAAVRAAAERAGVEAYIVGGGVRDALLGESRGDLDVVTEGDHVALAQALGERPRVHGRFATATVATPYGPIDVARARADSYPRPGALPEVTPASLADDLGRRDFTINAIAASLADPGVPIDPYGGIDDLRAELLRVLHPRSFTDDPTRALRAGRYAARFGFALEEETEAGLRRADLTTVSTDRVEAELRKLALEPDPRRGFELLDAWGLIELAPAAGETMEVLVELLGTAPWRDVADRADAVVAIARGDTGLAPTLAGAPEPNTPSAAVELARGRTGVELVTARAMGAVWLDRYVAEWRHVRPAISGADLIAAGVEQGPAVGRGLAAALRARLDGEVGDREAELDVALAAARDAEA